MTRKEQIMDAALFFAKKNKNNPSPYFDFVEAAEWADRTMIERVRNKLQEYVYDNYFEMHEDFIDEFCKKLMEN
ncbi:MAG: hypothetical protein IKU29_06205 [Parabacteroides sp.]|nr:hypothetical protein [Parabacteroides sp.]